MTAKSDVAKSVALSVSSSAADVITFFTTDTSNCDLILIILCDDPNYQISLTHKIPDIPISY